MSGAVVAVTQWLVRATDDRVVTASNPVRLPHIACVFRRHNKPSVPSIMVSMMGDVNIVYINIDFLNETFFMKFTLSRICLDWLIFLQNDLKRSGLHSDCLCIYM